MSTFVHLTREKVSLSIKRSGIGLSRSGTIHAMPVVPNFVLTHQWVRELQKWSRSQMIGIYFRIGDEEIVRVGRYNSSKREVTAAAAAAMLRDGAELGFEVEILRAIRSQEIHLVRKIKGIVGWRHSPGAHSRRPCGCPACVMRGEPGGRKLRDAWKASLI